MYNIYYENWFWVDTYKTDWCISDEETVLDKYGSVEELKKYHNKEIDFNNAVSNVNFENYDEY